ncbi:MAG TPA: PAS domain S-box protein [Anaerolineales bacterium]|nr:PAS domain S-box protein [Anaerolineales bacterium]
MDEKLLSKSLGTSDQKKTTVERANSPSPPGNGLSVQLQHIFDHIPEAIVFVNREGRIQNMNEASKFLIGEPDESFGLDAWPERFGLYLDDAMTYYPAHKMPLVRALRGETVQGEEIILRRDNSQIGAWISMSAAPFKDENGRIEGAIALVRDITYRKRIELSQEKHARRTEALYKLSRRIAEAGHDLNRITHLVAGFTSEVIGDLSVVMLPTANGQKLRAVAYHDSEPSALALVRKKLMETSEFDASRGIESGVLKSGEPLLIPSIESEQLHSAALPALTNSVSEIGVQSILIVPLIGRSGVIGTLNLFRHAGHKPYNIEDQSFLMDISYRTVMAIENCRLFDSLRAEISERQSTERALDISEERFRAIFESTTLGIKVLDLDGNILQTNAAFQRMMGYTESEFFGRHFLNFIHPDDVGRASKLFHGLKMSGIPFFRFEHRTVHKNQSILWVKTVFSVVKRRNTDDEVAFVVGIVENITEQKRIEMEMAELNSRLQNSMELERLRLAQELHDNPMQALYSAIYRVEELRAKADLELRAQLETVNNDIKSVLQGLRATAKELRPPTIFNFGLENAIRSHTDDFEEKHPDIKISLSLAHDRQLLPEKVRLALFRVFQQSLANVLRHSEATEVQVRFSFDAEEARLEISDNGKGFEVPSNWIEFVRQGHYGLAGAAERVQTLGGTFQVESQPGESTVVRAIIPWKDSME